jgi:tryptophan-rich sensory protein
MIIWKGWGILVAVIFFAIGALVGLFTQSFFHNPYYYEENGWPKFLTFSLAAGAVWYLAHYLNKKPGRVVIDKETSQEITLKPQHDLFFIKLEYWPYILFLIGVILLFVKT